MEDAEHEFSMAADIEGLPLEVRERERDRGIKAIRDCLDRLEKAPADDIAFAFTFTYSKRMPGMVVMGDGDTVLALIGALGLGARMMGAEAE